MSFLDRLEKVKPNGNNKWMACCPVHGDKTPSLGIKQVEDGSYIMNCFGCGANGVDVFRALGLDYSELFGDQERGDFVPAKIKEQYEDDKWFLAVYNADVKRGVKPGYKDNRRKRLAEARMRGIEAKYKVAQK